MSAKDVFEPFEDQLAKVAGTIHLVFMDDYQHRMENGLLGYYSKADDLRQSAVKLMAVGGNSDVYSMLCGMALEVLMKGIARGLDNPAEFIHDLSKLANHIGVQIDEDEQVLFEVMTQHIVWAGRYTAPKPPKQPDPSWSKIFDLKDKQRSGSGNFATMDIPSRIVSPGTFHCLWSKFADYFYKVQQSRYENAAFKREQGITDI